MTDSRVTLAYIRWFDATIGQGGTFTPEEAHGTHEQESAGIIICEDKTSITIALDRCINTKGLRCTLCIPKVNVRNIKRFKVAK